MNTPLLSSYSKYKMSFEVIPSIDLLDGKCVRLVQGRYDAATVYSDNPIQLLNQFISYGAKRIHIVDLNAARQKTEDYKSPNSELICSILESFGKYVQIAGGIRTREKVYDLFQKGAKAVVLGNLAISNFELLKELSLVFPNQVFVAIDMKDGKLATFGWEYKTPFDAIDIIRRYNNLPLAGLIVTAIERDGTMKGPDLELIKQIQSMSSHNIYASGGTRNLEDIIRLKSLGIKGVIVGKAVYEGGIDLKEAFKTASL